VKYPVGLVGSFWDEAYVLAIISHDGTAGHPASIQRGDLLGQPRKVGALHLLRPREMFVFMTAAEKENLIAMLYAASAIVLKCSASIPGATAVFVPVVPDVSLTALPLHCDLTAASLLALAKDLSSALICLQGRFLHSAPILGSP
jgi:hypothetical protein